MKTGRLGTKQITIMAILLALSIVSQIFKNISVFITGPIINACIILAVLSLNIWCGLILSIITPVTAYFIAASPVMMAVPAIVPFIMAGNAVLAISVHFLLKKDICARGKAACCVKNYLLALLCAFLKAAFMGLTISLWLLPTFIPAESPMRCKLSVLQSTFSLVQFATAAIGFVIVFILISRTPIITAEERN
ncbi:MAG: ECF transporter S component [Lachnospiraceae bacterium]|nr:ECF transporter S component [Lachnospiraceae bacterium]